MHHVTAGDLTAKGESRWAGCSQGIIISVDGFITGHFGVRQSPFATFTDYRVKSEGGES